MRSTLFLLTVLSISPALAEQIDDALCIGRPFDVSISPELEEIQKASLTSNFTGEFKTFGDLTSGRLEKFVSGNPQLFRPINLYLQNLYRNRYLDPEQFLSLRCAAIKGINKTDLNGSKGIPNFSTHLISQLKFDPTAPSVTEIREKQKFTKHRLLVALKEESTIEMLASSSSKQAEKKSDNSKDIVKSPSADERNGLNSGPHRGSIAIFGSNISGYHNNVSMTPSRQPFRDAKTEGVRFGGYLPTNGENLSVRLALVGQRTHYEYGYTGSSLQSHEANGSISLVYGRSNMFTGEGYEVGFGLQRDQHTNNFVVLSGSRGLGAGWSITGSYYDQISTNRQAYEAPPIGWFKDEYRGGEIGLTKHLFEGVAVSTLYQRQEMESGNGDSYKIDAWYGEVGYFF